MNIGIVGFGGVGKAFVKLLYDKKNYLEKIGLDINLLYIINSTVGIYNPEGINLKNLIENLDLNKKLDEFYASKYINTNFNKMIEIKDIDTLIVMTPTNKETGQPGLSYIKQALENKINVVTADKGPVMLAYKKLNELAIKNNVQFKIGCTCGGALPTVNTGTIDMAGADILSIEGILNGTTNFILEHMENNMVSYHEALLEAQRLGIAETNPSLDVEGWDTAIKLLILTNVLMNQEKKLSDIAVKGITSLSLNDIEEAKRENMKYKLIGKTTNDNGNIHMSVNLEKIDISHPFYIVNSKNKGVRYISDTLGDLTIMGGASGVRAASASILRDIININC
ncbi:homoserine dehydrogenase [Maledivibacter halophilus]|uniref:Homoserine dehydrogenase n=1 Tax=Maledivibacter halophilus TaxID=36842 RepID=A0A1T5MX05_9FIRM|nr:Gfo/Idh/MocA family oxidoreductase [Maledivibacter halophilus]SKC92604.1 homoserine dehydrogenase [Maledivibacter halophilus]